MEAIFLFLVSAAGVSQCQGAVAPSANYGHSSPIFTTPANRSPPISDVAVYSTPRRSSVFYGRPFPHHRPSVNSTLTSSNRKPPGIMKSSSTLSRDYIEKVLDATEELEWFTEGKHGDGSALLTPDVYQGKRMLVYKLAPGAIFGGVRTESKNHKNKKSQSSATDVDDYENTHANTDPRVVKSAYRRYKGDKRKKFIHHPVFKWGVQYLQEPTPLTAMKNPYVPSDSNNLRLGSRAKQKLTGRVKIGARGVGSGSEDVVVRWMAQTVHWARSKARGAWVSLLLLHYLGFLPRLPGLPRHTDPDQVTPSVVNSPSRAL